MSKPLKLAQVQMCGTKTTDPDASTPNPGPQVQMCANQASITQQFVTFNVPLGQKPLPLILIPAETPTPKPQTPTP